MQYSEALEIIKDSQPTGFMVQFARVQIGVLYPDHFPEKHKGEELIKTEEEAWKIARKFAAVSWGKYINIHVVDSNFHPVNDYQTKMIKNR